MIDTHIHLDDSQYDSDREEIIREFFGNGGEALVNIGAGLGSSRRSVELAKGHEKIFASIGLHPHYFMKHEIWNTKHKEKFKSLLNKEKIVSIGEIGLDYHSHTEEKISEGQKKIQKEGFIYQLNLAKESNLPVIIHCRGERSEAGSNFRETSQAYEDVLAIIENFPDLKYVFHGYGGRKEFTEKIVDKDNIFVSFNGNITYAKSNAEIIDVIKLIPLSKIMLETDGPYLAPVPHRGKRNEPIFVEFVAEKIAEVKNMSIKNVEKETTENAKKFFGI